MQFIFRKILVVITNIFYNPMCAEKSEEVGAFFGQRPIDSMNLSICPRVSTGFRTGT
jgi:hypothetical protein